MKAKDKPGTPIENNVAPFGGCVAGINEDGTYVRYICKGFRIGEGETFFPSREEAYAYAGKEFIPSSRIDFSDATLEEIDKRENQIKDCMGKIDSSFEEIAFSLYWINARKGYVGKGYRDIVTYCSGRLGYEKTTCYSLIGIVERFAKRDAGGNVLEELDPSVKGYSVSKLSLMVNLTDGQIKQLKPSMSVREIKKYIKGLEEKLAPALPDGSTGADGEGESGDLADSTGEDNTIDATAKGVNRSILIACKGSADYEKKSSKIGSSISRILKKHPDALIEISYTLP